MRVLSVDHGRAGHFIKVGWKNAFEHLGHRFTLASDVAAAHGILNEQPFDLAILVINELEDPMVDRLIDRAVGVIVWAQMFCDEADGRTLRYWKTEIDNIPTQDIRKLERLRDAGLLHFVFTQLSDRNVERFYYNYPRKLGIKPVALPLACDTFVYYEPGEFNPEFEFDIAFVGGWWTSKGENLNKYILPLVEKYRCAVYGNEPWPFSFYRGQINTDDVKYLLKQSKISPCIHEPIAVAHGFDVNERPFKVLGCGGFPICDGVREVFDFFGPDEIVYTESLDDYLEKVDYYIQHPERRLPIIERGKRRVLQEHTYIHRVQKILANLNLSQDRSLARSPYPISAAVQRGNGSHPPASPVAVTRPRSKRVLYVAMKYDYGNKYRGLSFEEKNFHDALRRYPGIEVIPFDFMTLSQRYGVARMSEMLVDTVIKEKPDLLFSVLYNETADPTHESIHYITYHTNTLTCLWMCDDHWRFEDWSQYWAPHFSYVVTTASSALPKYERLGYKHKVIKSQWACNHHLYVPYDIPQDNDVTFIGQPHSNRHGIIEYLKSKGIHAAVYGWGWKAYPRIPFNEMVRMFSRTKINLNLSNSSTNTAQQIKGRNFEVPGCRGFLLTGNADNLEEYYVPGEEVVVYEDLEDLVEKIRYYLNNDRQRKEISERGYRRTIHEHTWWHRFNRIFSQVGLIGSERSNFAR